MGMKVRIAMIAVSVLLGLTAAFAVISYTSQVRKATTSKSEIVDVLVAKKALPVGLTLDELLARNLVEAKKEPRDVIPEGYLGPGAKLGSKVLAVPLEAGEELTASKFRVPVQAGLAYTTPLGTVAVALPVDEGRSVGSLLKVGDFVDVVGTIEGRGNESETRVVLSKVQVLAVGTILDKSAQDSAVRRRGIGAGSGPASAAPKTVTVAIKPRDVVKLVSVLEEGKVWLALWPPAEAAPGGSGQAQAEGENKVAGK